MAAACRAVEAGVHNLYASRYSEIRQQGRGMLLDMLMKGHPEVASWTRTIPPDASWTTITNWPQRGRYRVKQCSSLDGGAKRRRASTGQVDMEGAQIGSLHYEASRTRMAAHELMDSPQRYADGCREAAQAPEGEYKPCCFFGADRRHVRAGSKKANKSQQS